jgi:hypothetical protein
VLYYEDGREIKMLFTAVYFVTWNLLLVSIEQTSSFHEIVDIFCGNWGEEFKPIISSANEGLQAQISAISYTLFNSPSSFNKSFL